jgi:hypothetical protein
MVFCRPVSDDIGAAAAGATSHGAVAAIDAATIILNDLLMTNLLITIEQRDRVHHGSDPCIGC